MVIKHCLRAAPWGGAAFKDSLPPEGGGFGWVKKSPTNAPENGVLQPGGRENAIKINRVKTMYTYRNSLTNSNNWSKKKRERIKVLGETIET